MLSIEQYGLHFAERVSGYMIIQDLNASLLAEKTGLPRTTVSGVLQGKHEPSTKVLITLADFFHCSADYLLGLTDSYSEEEKFIIPTEKFAVRLKRLMKSAGVSQYRLTKSHQISGHLIYKWLSGESIPSTFNLIKLSTALDVSVDCLLGRES